MKNKLLNNLADGRRLYAISPPQLYFDFFAELDAVARAESLCAFQLRLKGCGDDEVLSAARRIKPVLDKHAIPLIINDSAALALEAGADGVHLGKADGAVGAARSVLGEAAVVGASAYDSLDVAQEAQAAGADYVCFGAFFDTTTKRAKTRATPEVLSAWRRQSSLSCGAIGGITAERAGALLAAGADFVAVSSALWQADDKLATARGFIKQPL